MIRDVNWWLTALAFLLGVLVTLALTIRKVTREVPVTRSVAVDVPTPAAVAGAGPVQDVRRRAEQVVHHVVEKEPYGAGSIRVSARTVGPAGFAIKGDKDTGRYFTADSPDYRVIEAEVWFADEESAEKAGFLHWNAQSDHAGGLGAEAVAVVTEDSSGSDATLVIIDDGDGDWEGGPGRD